MPKHRDFVARDPPPVENDEEEDSGEDESSSEAEEEENQVSEPEPPQKQNSQVKKTPRVVAQSEQQQASDTPSATSKKPFDRLWSEDDEIVVLKGMIDYRAKKKVNPKADLDGFFEFIKNSVSIDVSKAQLHNKIRTLKRKYDKCNKKVSLKKGHEQIAFDLLKKIWGGEAADVDHNLGTTTKANRVALKKSMDDAVKGSRDDVDMVQRSVKRSRPNVEEPILIEGLRVESWIEKVVMPSLKGEKRVEVEEKWKEFKLQELEIHVKKLELLVEQTKMILKAYEH